MITATREQKVKQLEVRQTQKTKSEKSRYCDRYGAVDIVILLNDKD